MPLLIPAVRADSLRQFRALSLLRLPLIFIWVVLYFKAILPYFRTSHSLTQPAILCCPFLWYILCILRVAFLSKCQSMCLKECRQTDVSLNLEEGRPKANHPDNIGPRYHTLLQNYGAGIVVWLVVSYAFALCDMVPINDTSWTRTQMTAQPHHCRRGLFFLVYFPNGF